jgi:hypothetical protein
MVDLAILGTLVGATILLVALTRGRLGYEAGGEGRGPRRRGREAGAGWAGECGLIGRAALHEVESKLVLPPTPASFSDAELEGLVEPVARYLTSAIAPGTPLARSARFTMHGSIKLGRRWAAFRAREVLAPHEDSCGTDVPWAASWARIDISNVEG